MTSRYFDITCSGVVDRRTLVRVLLADAKPDLVSARSGQALSVAPSDNGQATQRTRVFPVVLWLNGVIEDMVSSFLAAYLICSRVRPKGTSTLSNTSIGREDCQDDALFERNDRIR